MCGIVGVVATGPVNQLLYDSLQLLQHRGHVLLSAGHSIAVQNFNENLSILIMLGVYALLIWLNLGIQTVMLLFGVFVAITMLLVMLRHQYNQRQFDSVALIGEVTH